MEPKNGSSEDDVPFISFSSIGEFLRFHVNFPGNPKILVNMGIFRR